MRKSSINSPIKKEVTCFAVLTGGIHKDDLNSNCFPMFPLCVFLYINISRFVCLYL